MLERLGPTSGPEQLVEAMDAANQHRADLLGSTTHISVIDADGMCAAVTCSNGSGSGVLVPGTGVILNNMLGEEDLNPRGFHRIPAGERVPSMMAPTVVLRDGEIVLAVGSAGSNRIRSAILQTVVRVVEQGMGPAEAIAAPRASTSRAAWCRPSRGSTRRRWPGSRRAGSPWRAVPRSTSSSAASRRSPAIRAPASSAAAAIRAAAAPSPTPDGTE